MELKRVKEAIVVEGKYDVIRVQSAVDAMVIPTDGFRIFKDPEKRELLRRVAEKRDVILLTDSDSAGTVIRNHLLGCIPAAQVKIAYIPPIPGKEKRKTAPGKEGLLGVEGVDAATILTALEKAGATFLGEADPDGATLRLTKADLFSLGLSGGINSAANRQALLKKLGLPKTLSSNRLLEVLNTTVTREELDKLLKTEETT